MTDKYQIIKDREYARLALTTADIDRKHKKRMRILTAVLILVIIAGCFLLAFY